MTATISTDATGSNHRVLMTVVAVLVAHAIVLGLLATMKPVQLKMPEPPKPVEVKFIQLAPPPKPEQPKPEPPKPKPKPKEVKVVKEIPKPKPLPKPKPVLATPAPSPKPQQAVVPPQPEPKPEPKVEPAPAPPPPKPAAPAPVIEPSQAEPKQVQTVAYIRKPKLIFSNNDLGNKPRSIKIKINITAEGNVEKVDVIDSTGLPSLDRMIVRAWKYAKFTPYKENGVAQPVFQYQSFTLDLASN